jgi:hypothetical protein
MFVGTSLMVVNGVADCFFAVPIKGGRNNYVNDVTHDDASHLSRSRIIQSGRTIKQQMKVGKNGEKNSRRFYEVSSFSFRLNWLYYRLFIMFSDDNSGRSLFHTLHSFQDTKGSL